MPRPKTAHYKLASTLDASLWAPNSNVPFTLSRSTAHGWMGQTSRPVSVRCATNATPATVTSAASRWLTPSRWGKESIRRWTKSAGVCPPCRPALRIRTASAALATTSPTAHPTRRTRGGAGARGASGYALRRPRPPRVSPSATKLKRGHLYLERKGRIYFGLTFERPI